MIAALERLKSASEPAHLPESVRAFGIRDGGKSFMAMLRSHPPLEQRIAALRSAR